MNDVQIRELLLQSLEHERGGVLIYRTALECALNDDLREEWIKYLAQTEHHVEVLSSLCSQLGYDPALTTPGCKIVQHTGKALVQAMKMALAEGDAAAAELVACECVVLAETKDHADWELIGQCAEAMDKAGDPAAPAMLAAYEEIEDEEDEHLYHTQGWCRELWLDALGLPAVLPPPEEKGDVKSAIAASKAKEKSIAARKH
jgi:hypothetical protein